MKADWVRIRDLARWVNLDEDDLRRVYYTHVEHDGDCDGTHLVRARFVGIAKI